MNESSSLLEKGISMNRLVMLFACLLLSISVFAKVREANVIYGDDDRVDSQDHESDVLKELSNSVAAMVKKDDLAPQLFSTVFTTPFSSLGDEWGLCEDEPFKDQASLANCTGFLVGEDILVTAGHCVRSQTSCDGYSWVFGFTNKTLKVGGNLVFPKKNVYSCVEILSQKLEGGTYDYAVVRLDRAVKGRAPLKFRTSGEIAPGTPLAVIGHPSGLPAKIADGAEVFALNEGFFTANLDTYGGNSGSPVFNLETNEVEGILVRGQTDYVYNYQSSCYASNRLENDNNGGDVEDVSTITSVEYLQNL